LSTRHTLLWAEIAPWVADKESRVDHVGSFQAAGLKDGTKGENERVAEEAAKTLRQRFMKDAGVKLLRRLRKPNDSISLIWNLWKDCIAMDKNFSPIEWRPKRSWQDYRDRMAIGVEIKWRSDGNDSRVLGIIKEMEEERKSFKSLRRFARRLVH
jgi:hypothetical protein